MKTSEIIVFIVYLLCMLGIGIFFFVKNRNGGEKTYFLGGREMGPWVAALSAGASDMSAWVLMGLPTSIYALGLGQVWIPVGLAIGYTISWLLEAPRLRKFSIVANDSITIPQYLTNRFLSKSLALQVICAIVFLVAYTIYAASSVKACGTLFHTVIGMDPQIAMYLAAVVIVGYTFLGGFSAVCWTDFFQGMLVLGSMFIAPIFAAFMLDTSSMSALPGGYLNPFSSWQDIVSGLAWGLGYFYFKNKDEYFRLCTMLFTGMTIFLIVSTIYPNGHYLRPTTFARDNVFVHMVKWLYTTDTATNLFPSIHVYNSIAVNLAIWHSGNFRDKKIIRIGSAVLMVSIILSTMFLKQHSVFDVVTGIIMAVFMYMLIYVQNPARMPAGERKYERKFL